MTAEDSGAKIPPVMNGGRATLSGPAQPTATQPRSRSLDLALRVRALRNRLDITLKDLSERSGISTSALSKLENGQLSPTYENIIRLARGLDVDITALFSDAASTGRKSVTRRGEGVRCDTKNYEYEMLCTDLARKQMIPLLARVKAHELRSFGPLVAHVGEEVIYVLNGKVVLHTKYYEPQVLAAGDCAYFDSAMPHGCVALGIEDATLFWVCSSSEVADLIRSASAEEPDTVKLKQSATTSKIRRKRQPALSVIKKPTR